jgi:hypothetical protein
MIDRPMPTPVPDRNIWVPAVLGLLTLLIHLATNRCYGYFSDEFYYIACGDHLAWGYVDHAPLIAAIAASAHALFGDSLFGVRFFPAVAHASLVLCTGAIARALGGGRFAQGLAALAVLTAPVYLACSTILNMNPFDQLLWSLCSFVLIGIFIRDKPRGWVLFGAIAGIGLMNKHSFILFLVAASLSLLLTRERRWLLTRGPWLASLIAAAIFLPNVVWQIRHHWPTLEFLRNALAVKSYSGSILEFTAAQVMLLHPVSAPLWIVGLGALLFSREMARARTLGLSFVLVWVVIVASKGKTYYLAPAYPPLFAAGAVALTRFANERRRAWIMPVYATMLALSSIVLAPLFIPMLSPESFTRYADAIGFMGPRDGRHGTAGLPPYFGDMFGWEDMVATVARVYHRLTPEERAHCTIFAYKYGEAGAINLLGRKYGLPEAVSGHNNFFLWGPPSADRNIVITVGEPPEDVGRACEEVEEAAVYRHDFNLSYEFMRQAAGSMICPTCGKLTDLPILVGRHFRRPWQQIWPGCKKYI